MLANLIIHHFTINFADIFISTRNKYFDIFTDQEFCVDDDVISLTLAPHDCVALKTK